jgi:hypothetical protein
MAHDRTPYIVLPVVAFVAVLPLILNGCSCGHDFDFHLLSWMEAASQFRHGNLHPHWAYTPAYNAGEPRFVFYPPVSWTIGAVLGLIFPWAWAPIFYTWLALTASGFALYRLARDFAKPAAALLAAVFYIVNPYMLFTAYERTAYAELLAAAWIPLLLHAILRPQITIPRIAIPIALLWLTNAPAAVMSCYALAVLAGVRIVPARRASFPSRSSSKATILRITAGVFLGLGLAAFYILPAAYERRYVQIAMAILPGMRIEDNFLFQHTADVLHDQVLHTASAIAVLLLALTAIAILILRVARPCSPESHPESDGLAVPQTPPLLLPVAILSVGIALMLTPLSGFVWRHAPELAFLQFPWRLLAILAAALSLIAAAALSGLTMSRTLTCGLALTIAVALSYPAYTVFQQPCDDEDNVRAREALFQSNHGSDPTDEYTPTAADNDSLAHANPGFWLSPNPDVKAPANALPAPVPPHLTIAPPMSEDLILDLRDYPNWRITDNGTVITAREQRDDGLIAVPVPAGPSIISITYTHSLDETIGWLLSTLSLLLLLFLLTRSRPSPRDF